MGDSAFQSAYADTDKSNMGMLSFENGSKLTSIPAYAFDKCLAFKGSIVIPEGLQVLGNMHLKSVQGWMERFLCHQGWKQLAIMLFLSVQS